MGVNEAVKFLERDFNQCFSQMRHYDSQFLDICKFMFTSYATLTGVAVGLYQYTIEKGINLIPAATAAIAIGLIIGLFLFSLIIRNRVYYVIVARYINEHRQLFLKNKPLGFENLSRMYVDISQPLFFNWLSSHAWFIYIFTVFNSFLLSMLLFLSFRDYKYIGLVILGCFILSIIIQLIISVWYLLNQENRASKGETRSEC